MVVDRGVVGLVKAGDLFEGGAGHIGDVLASCLKVDCVLIAIGFDGTYVVIEQGRYLEPL